MLLFIVIAGLMIGYGYLVYTFAFVQGTKWARRRFVKNLRLYAEQKDLIVIDGQSCDEMRLKPSDVMLAIADKMERSP